MKVKQLMKKLAKADPRAEVYFDIVAGEEIRGVEFKRVPVKGEDPRTVVLLKNHDVQRDF